MTSTHTQSVSLDLIHLLSKIHTLDVNTWLFRTLRVTYKSILSLTFDQASVEQGNNKLKRGEAQGE